MAQIPWVVETNGPTQVLDVPSIWTVQVDSSIAGTGDALGVFVVDSNDVEVCVGAISLSDSTGYLTVYGQDSMSTGLSPGEKLAFRLYDQLNQCEFITVVALGDSGEVYFSPGDTTIVNSISAYSSSINYPITQSCEDEELFLYSDEFVPVTYMGDQGLALDTLSGTVDVINSQPGNHVIALSSEICLLEDSVMISIYALPTLELIGDTISCEAENIELSVLTDGNAVFWSTGDTSLSTSVMSPYSGNVSVMNDNGCNTTDTFELSVSGGFEINDLQIQEVNSACEDSTELTFDLANFPGTLYAVVLNFDTIGWSNSQLQTQVSSGNYEVVVVDELGCTESIDIVVSDETVKVEEISLTVSQPVCGGGGEVQGFYNDEELTLLIENEDPSSLQSGLYDLSISLDNECVISWSEKIEIIEPVGCQSEVMYPDTDGAEATFYISTEGSTTIIDRNGQLVRSLQTPGHWDGRDDNNVLVPMGEYYIITNESSSITISVIR